MWRLKMDYTEIKCPKCESENFDEIDYENSCDIDNNKNVRIVVVSGYKLNVIVIAKMLI
jgi:hypothetical protein